MASSKQETECVVRLLASRIEKFVHCHRASRKDMVHLGLVNPPVTSLVFEMGQTEAFVTQERIIID